MTGTPPATTATVTRTEKRHQLHLHGDRHPIRGSGPASEPSNAVTPTAPTAPSAPDGGHGDGRRTGQAHGELDGPVDNGGSPITSYTVTPYVGSQAQTASRRCRHPARDQRHRQRTDKRHQLHVQGHRHQRGRGRPAVQRLQRGHTDGPDGARSSASATPRRSTRGTRNSVELGVKFSSEVAGNVTGIRFYKATTNTGTHIGSLWSRQRTLLASATFTGETRLGLAAGQLLNTRRDHRRTPPTSPPTWRPTATTPTPPRRSPPPA